jgi:formate dehydrogenase maturation protein FdhE
MKALVKCTWCRDTGHIVDGWFDDEERLQITVKHCTDCDAAKICHTKWLVILANNK